MAIGESSVIVTLFAEIKEYMAKMKEAEGSMEKLGTTSMTTSEKLSAFGQKAATAMVAFGVSALAYGVDSAYKLQEALDKVQNQSSLTGAQVDALRTQIIAISNATGQSSVSLANASLTISQAGIKGAAAYTLLNDAARAAVITNSDLTSTTQALIAAQTLQVSKGLSITELTGKLVAGSKDFVGGLSAEEQMLSGRVGVALANYGLQLQQIIPIGAEFSKVALPARSVSSFAQSLGNLENPTKAYAKALDKVGLSATNLGAYVRTGNVIGLLKQINEEATKGGGPLSQYVNAVFGKTGGAAASVLIKNLGDLVKTQQAVAAGGPSSLAGSFAEAAKQLGPQLKIFDANLTNALISIGQKVLPLLSDALKGLNGLFKNKAAVDAIGATLATAFAASLAVKISNLVKSVMGIFGKGAQVEATIANTAALEANTAAIGGETAAGGASALSGAAKIGAIGSLSDLAGPAAGLVAGLMIGAYGADALKKRGLEESGRGLYNIKTGQYTGPGSGFAQAQQRITLKATVKH